MTLIIPEFFSTFQAQLPADVDLSPNTRQVLGACYSRAQPRQASQPQRIAVSQTLIEELGFDTAFVTSGAFDQAFVGNAQLPGMEPYAMCYGGHQFGQWAGQLGDGRAINLGEVKDRHGQLQAIQLKGAGPTPYSRFADGLAVLRSSTREFLCSEAMHFLGVPTTRALSLIATGDAVERDMFYDGHPQLEPGAVVARVAPSFLRFGNFEIFAARGDEVTLRRLMEFTLKHHFPNLWSLYQRDSKQAILAWFAEVCDRTCTMVVHWMRVGFVHGVMNTDNMSVLGLTIDYGPYGWLDNFDPTWTPNTTDFRQRRYRYQNQAAVAQWNLLQLANAIYPLVQSAPELEQQVQEFQREYDRRWQAMMLEKLGLGAVPVTNTHFLSQLETLLVATQADMTLFFRRLPALAHIPLDDDCPIRAWLSAIAYREDLSSELCQQWRQWLGQLQAQVVDEARPHEQRRQQMDAVNPHFILRNYVAQMAIEQAYEGDYGMIEQCLVALEHPYASHPSHRGISDKRPAWALDKAGCSTLSCSS